MSKNILFIDIKRIQVLSLVVFLIELLFFTFWRNILGPLLSPIVLFSSSFFLGLICIHVSKFEITESHNTQFKADAGSLLLCATSFLGIGYVVLQLLGIYQDHPINIYDAKNSDIIPQIGILTQRFLEGEFPYKVIQIWGWDLFPTYLPMHWMPFVLSDYLNIDIRWPSLILLILSIVIVQIQVFKKQISLAKKLIVLVLPILMCLLLIADNKKNFAFTVESLIAGYYLILCTTVFSKSNVLKSIGLLLCLLSRYSLILWVPLYFLVVLLEKKKNAFQISLMVLLGFFVIYYIPFLSQDVNIFLKGFGHHIGATIQEWNPGWQNPGEKPFHLFQGIGLACYFYEYYPGTLEDRIYALKNVHVIASILSIVILTFYYLKNRNQLSNNFYLLGALKLYFCFFYYLFQIPYSYLYIVPIMISLYIVVRIFIINSIQTLSPDIKVNQVT